MVSVKLVIKNADFSVNACDVIIDSDITLQLITSIKYFRCLQSENYGGNFYTTYQTAANWHCYAVDVSRFVGRTVRITYSDGYASDIYANGAFLNASAPGFSEGFGKKDMGQDTSLNQYVVGLVCPVEENEANIEITNDYTVPLGAKWLLFESKTTGVVTVPAG